MYEIWVGVFDRWGLGVAFCSCWDRIFLPHQQAFCTGVFLEFFAWASEVWEIVRCLFLLSFLGGLASKGIVLVSSFFVLAFGGLIIWWWHQIPKCIFWGFLGGF